MVQFVTIVVLMRVERRQWLMLREKMEILRNHRSVFLSCVKVIVIFLRIARMMHAQREHP
jgi:hypothetical protein